MFIFANMNIRPSLRSDCGVSPVVNPVGTRLAAILSQRPISPESNLRKPSVGNCQMEMGIGILLGPTSYIYIGGGIHVCGDPEDAGMQWAHGMQGGWGAFAFSGFTGV
jgi:hypothetical protein